MEEGTRRNKRQPWRFSALLIFVLLVQTAAGHSRIILVTTEESGANPDPQRNNTVYGYIISELVADTLLVFDGQEFVPALATSWERSEDQRSYTFHLREGVEFHNAARLDSALVRGSFERVLDPDDPLPGAENLTGIVDIATPDDRTITFTLATPDPDFLLTLTRIWIVDAMSAPGGGVPVGSGPYIITAFQPDKQITLRAFSYYWAGQAGIIEIVTRNISDSEALIAELEAGSIDGILSAPPNEVKRLSEAGFEVLPFGPVKTAFVALNNAKLDVALRRAICYAVDREVLMDYAYGGFGEAEHTISMPGTWAFDSSVPGYSYDPQQAMAILDAAGYVDTDGDGVREKDGKRLNLDFQARDDGTWQLAAEIIQQHLRRVGIDTTISPNDSRTYAAKIRAGDYEIAWWVDMIDPETKVYAEAFHSLGRRDVSHRGKDLDSYIEAGRSGVILAARAHEYFKLQRMVYEQAVQCPQFWVEEAHVLSPRLRDVKAGSVGVLIDSQHWRLE